MWSANLNGPALDLEGAACDQGFGDLPAGLGDGAAAIGGFGMLGVFSRIVLETKRVYSGDVEVRAFAPRDLAEMMEYMERRRAHADRGGALQLRAQVERGGPVHRHLAQPPTGGHVLHGRTVVPAPVPRPRCDHWWGDALQPRNWRV